MAREYFADLNSKVDDHDHDASDLTTGVLPVVRGGTGVDSSTGTGSVVRKDFPVLSGTVQIDNGKLQVTGNGTDLVRVKRSSESDFAGISWLDEDGKNRALLYLVNNSQSNISLQIRNAEGAIIGSAFTVDNDTAKVDFPSGLSVSFGKKVWTEDNDGSGSGLDADLLDGLESSAFAQLAQPTTFLSTFIANHTQHGFTDTSLITFSSASHWAKPQGWSGMIHSNSVGMPTSSHCYWTILGRRDTSGGYGGLLVEYAGGRVWYGYSDNDTKSPTWIELTNQSAGLSGTALNPIQLGVAENLNTVTASGIYACTSDLDAQAGSNYPEDLAGSLQVVNAPPSITQTYITRTGNMHVRGTATGTWKKVTAT